MTTKNVFIVSLSVAILHSLLSYTSILTAQGLGDLLVTPTRALFEDGKRNEVLTLINQGSDTATYRMSVIQYRMTLQGGLEKIESPDSGQYFATDYVRFFPRQVTIAPGESQNVRVQLRLPADLPEREYRSHLYFRSVPKQQALTAADDTISPTEFSVNLQAVFGVAIPVIIRQGELPLSVSLHDVALDVKDDEKPSISMRFHRRGERSIYGNLRIMFTKNGETPIQIGGIGGVAIYTPNQDRTFKLPLQVPEDINLSNGKIIVEYENGSDLEGRELLARAELPIE